MNPLVTLPFLKMKDDPHAAPPPPPQVINDQPPKEPKAILKDKAKRSIFETCHHLNFLRLPIDISNRLFNSLYLIFLMYGSEVWSICDKDDDETQIQFCKV